MQMNLFVRLIRSATWILVGDLSRLDALVDLTRLLLKSEENVHLCAAHVHLFHQDSGLRVWIFCMLAS